jgi:hypothetical protein
MTTDTEATWRIAANIVFANMRDAYAAADKLEAAGYEVKIAQDIIAEDNGDWLGKSTAFAEAYKALAGVDEFACMRAGMAEVTAIIKPPGMCVGAWPIDPATHMAFSWVDQYGDVRI